MFKKIKRNFFFLPLPSWLSGPLGLFPLRSDPAPLPLPTEVPRLSAPVAQLRADAVPLSLSFADEPGPLVSRVSYLPLMPELDTAASESASASPPPLPCLAPHVAPQAINSSCPWPCLPIPSLGVTTTSPNCCPAVLAVRSDASCVTYVPSLTMKTT